MNNNIYGQPFFSEYENDDYDNAQICLNGHVITSTAIEEPSDLQDYCEKCSEKTISECSNCSNKIRGRKPYYSSFNRPNYCIYCGNPFPWVARTLEAIDELADCIDDFDESDREILKNSLRELINETPREALALFQTKKILKNTEEHVLEAFKNILYNVISSHIFKQLWG